MLRFVVTCSMQKYKKQAETALTMGPVSEDEAEEAPVGPKPVFLSILQPPGPPKR